MHPVIAASPHHRSTPIWSHDIHLKRSVGASERCQLVPALQHMPASQNSLTSVRYRRVVGAVQGDIEVRPAFNVTRVALDDIQ
eukprot:3197153-Rhodomonas_salina.1